jgi:hypothetical protein
MREFTPELPLFGIQQLKYSCNEEEHKRYIDRINTNPANCEDCGRLIPADILFYPYQKHLCNQCFWNRRCKEQNFKPTFDYNYEAEIAELKKNHPEYFQKVI